MYTEEMCTPMREDLTSVGFLALRTPDEVSKLLDKYFASFSLSESEVRSINVFSWVTAISFNKGSDVMTIIVFSVSLFSSKDLNTLPTE